MSKQEIKRRDKHITRQIHKLMWEANFVRWRLLLITYLFRIPGAAVFNIGMPLVVAHGIKAILDGRFDQVATYAIWIVSLAFAYSFLWGIGGVAASYQFLAGSKYIQNKVFENFLAKDYDFYTNAYFGSLGAQAIRMRDAFYNYGNIVTLDIPRLSTLIVGSLLVIGYYSIDLAIITIVSMLIVLSYTILASSWRLQFRRETAQAGSDVAAAIGDSLSHGTTIKSFASEDYESKILQEPLNKWGSAQFKAWVSFVPADSGRVILAGIATALILIYSAQLYQAGSIPIIIVILIQLYVIRLIMITHEVTQVIKSYEEVMGSAYEPVITMLVPVNIKDPENPKALRPGKNHLLEFKAVSYRYPEAKKAQYAVKDFTLKIKSGEKVGLVGYSGSGKSTLTKLLLRFMDIGKGKIMIDGIDIRDITQKDLRGKISYVPQEPLLFHRKIFENIAYAKPDTSKSEVIKAAKMAYVDEFVDELPKGYDTFVGERGVKLSGGQRQRVAIARALLKDSPILVLDEATSALDSKSEKYIQDGLRKLMKNRTSLVIAHRLSTIQRMDRIVVMDKGRVVQTGTHEELLKDKTGIYAKLWSHQSGGYIGGNSGSQNSLAEEPA